LKEAALTDLHSIKATKFSSFALRLKKWIRDVSHQKVGLRT